MEEESSQKEGGGCLLLLAVAALLVALITSLGDSPTTTSIHQVTGPPTLSVHFIDSVLAAAGSPAAGTGATLYTESLRYGIDDAIALAFFKEESSFGTTGIATVTHSLGNIRCSAGYACYSGFRYYDKWGDGERDWYQLIRDRYLAQGLTSIEAILPVYAPSTENDTQAYIEQVNADVASWRATN